jgi:tetratricopeptide (TPR) repeat protein
MADSNEALKQIWAAALGHFQAGRLAEAEAAYRRFLETVPTHPGANYNLAVTLRARGLLEQAAAQYERTIAVQPGNAKAHNNLAVILADLDRADEAIGHYRRALSIQPDFDSAHYNLANLLRLKGEHGAAIEHYRRALAASPDDAEFHNNLGMALFGSGQIESAADAYRRALTLRPGYAEACSNLGAALVEQGRIDEAAAHFQRALALKPDYADARFNLAHALEEQEREPEAETQYELALALDPGHAEAHNNFGLMSQRLGRLEEALARFERAQALKPDYVEAHWNESLARLVTGDFETGWREYEWRWRRKETPPRRLQVPAWDGGDLNGKTILLHAEQGIGDAIQFIRYAPLVKARGGTVVFESPPGLRSLVDGMAGLDRVIGAGDPLPPFDHHAPLLSLPALLGTTLETIPADTPYLAADPERVAAWRDRLSGLSRSKVGLVWRGNPKHGNDRHRSIPSSTIAALVKSAEVDWVCLQLDARPDELAAFAPTPMIEAGPLLGDWADTAAAVAALDLVITVDTSIAHLAGALGKPVWTLIPFAPDWRWLLKRTDTPWYPSMRLFRQDAPGDWGSALARAGAALAGGTATPAAPAVIRRRLPPALVVSHERSGTHFLMNSLSYAYGYTAEPWIDLDHHNMPIDYSSPPAIAQALEGVAGDPLMRIVKSHHAVDQFAGELERILSDYRIFYVHRDPAEVMVSLWRHLNGLAWDEGPKVASPLALAQAAPTGRLTRYQARSHATMIDRWAAHVEGWLAAAEAEPRIIPVRYEDLDTRYALTMEALAEAVGRAPLAPLLRPPKDVNVIAMGLSARAAQVTPAEMAALRAGVRSTRAGALMDRLG